MTKLQHDWYFVVSKLTDKTKEAKNRRERKRDVEGVRGTSNHVVTLAATINKRKCCLMFRPTRSSEREDASALSTCSLE